mmetsp:Transcript_21303/g.31984  ORF Transcript_21303/g.31984 Transcript_21303/m.31984 type:complete len:383 (+) Transcript_21303:110-1258(+)|eukprot:CAMPEP_0203672378 /NCGR_PEP_ID=MMETSP0090-20130426/8296_1 /ASSEMBLY_ACC=CAM_ASM_001088 /TAXON_ID=426623 /ORGANISM="Chaetoceros affinis, Strain CCMP159" /LENGTH=382 /DNA_ID=CAMNT_0050537687 /DNA_START=51 /DNA_END=1199 /DNA_ORIENTATION=+
MKFGINNLLVTLTTTTTLIALHAIGSDAFSPLTPSQITRKPGAAAPLSATNFDVLSDRGGVKRRRIEREWTYTEDDGTEYEGKGKFETYVFLPEGEVKGCAVFMHGFSQYTLAYRETLLRVAKKANIAIISPETGITSGIVLGELLSKPLELIKDRNRAQFVLQRALSEDAKQCIRMVMDGEEVFKDLKIKKNTPLGVCGHSMGGGLSFPVAAEFQRINYVFTMAPAAGVPQFDPISNGVEKRTVANSMLLAGSCDLIARPTNVMEISQKSNEKKKNSSTFVEIKGGLHTGFEDELVITRIPLDRIIVLVFGFNAILDLIALAFAGFLRTNTGQLEGSELLMEFFFDKMANGRKVDPNAADIYLKDNLDNLKWYNKFNITNV